MKVNEEGFRAVTDAPIAKPKRNYRSAVCRQPMVVFTMKCLAGIGPMNMPMQFSMRSIPAKRRDSGGADFLRQNNPADVAGYLLRMSANCHLLKTTR
jgi:hypothetical protein